MSMLLVSYFFFFVVFCAHQIVVVIEFGVFLKKIFDTDLYLISITDSPDKPEGPLEVGNITPDSCVLTWNAPKVSAILSFAMYMFHSVAIGKILFGKKKKQKKILILI